MAPGTEPFVSGQGIANIYNYLKDGKKLVMDGVLKEIDKAKDEDKPALISKNAKDNPVCRDIMKLFRKNVRELCRQSGGGFHAVPAEFIWPAGLRPRTNGCFWRTIFS